MSRVVRFYSLGGPEVLRLEEREIPEPGAGEVLIKVEAIGLNRADVMFRTGRYLEKATFPSQMGFEGSGTVLATGPGVESFRAGDAVGVMPGFDPSKMEAGAYAVIATQEESLEQRLQELTDGMLNCAFDAVGGPQVASLAEAMAPRGCIVIHGALSPEDTPFPLKLALKKSLTFRGYVYTEVTKNADCLARAQKFIAQGIASGTLRPYIDRTFSLDKVIDAHRYLESNQQFGKVVLTT